MNNTEKELAEIEKTLDRFHDEECSQTRNEPCGCPAYTTMKRLLMICKKQEQAMDRMQNRLWALGDG